MSGIAEFLTELAAQDIKLWVEAGKLRVNAPQGGLTPALRQALTERKAELLAFLGPQASASAAQALGPRQAGAPVPLTYGQERIWSLAKLEPASSVYNVPTVFMLVGPLNARALERGLDAMARRHEILHTRFPGGDLAEAHQEIREPQPVVLPVTHIGRDLAKMPRDRVGAAIQRLLHDEVAQPFDLAQGPLWRARLFQLGPKRYLLAFTMHHIIFDGVSKALFLKELAEQYQAALPGGQAPLPPPPLQFADYAVWQRTRLDEAAMARQLAYWRERLSGVVPELITPNDRPRQAGKGRVSSLRFGFPAQLTLSLAGLSQREQTSLFATLLTAFYALLQGYSGQEDLVLCTPMASRDSVDIEKMLGYFNNIVVIRADLSGNPGFRQLLGQVRRLVLEAFDNQFLPLQRLAQLPNLIRTPLTRAMFSYQDSTSRRLKLPGVEARPLSVRKDAADFDLAVYIEHEGDHLTGVLDFNAALFSPHRIKLLINRFGALLESVAADPDRRLRDMPTYGRTLADIEALLASHAQIDQAVVVLDPPSGRLYAYLVLNEDQVPSLEVVREFAASRLPAYRVPAAFIPLDELPLLPDGAVDHGALPPPQFDRGRLATDYVAPRTPLEATLAEIWQRVLWLDHAVGVNDAFRDLGGHSLLSVQLVIEIEKALGRPVPAKALAALDTLAGLAQALEQGEGEAEDGGTSWVGGKVLPQDVYRGLRSYTASWQGSRSSEDAVIVGLNTSGKRQGLFWCLQRYQELVQLAKYLGPEQPVYGMRSGNRVMVKTQDNINLLAAYYVEEILAIQPEGPYLIGGNCQAAHIAFQVATQLQGRGREITLLILHEKFVPFSYAGNVVMLFGDRSVFNPYRYFRKPEEGWHKYYAGPLAVSLVNGGHGQFFHEPYVQGFVAGIAGYIAQAQAGGFDSPLVRPTGEAGRQILPEGAYRARLRAPRALTAEPGQALTLTVEVTNASSCEWRPARESGILLANRWLDAGGKLIQPLDGRTFLADLLPPGAAITMDLIAHAPREPGDWLLELDLVDEGVAWFQEKGSPRTLVNVNVCNALA